MTEFQNMILSVINDPDLAIEAQSCDAMSCLHKAGIIEDATWEHCCMFPEKWEKSPCTRYGREINEKIQEEASSPGGLEEYTAFFRAVNDLLMTMVFHY